VVEDIDHAQVCRDKGELHEFYRQETHADVQHAPVRRIPSAGRLAVGDIAEVDQEIDISLEQLLE